MERHLIAAMMVFFAVWGATATLVVIEATGGPCS